MTDYTIPMIIGMTLAFTLGAGFGALWGISRHEWLYCRITAYLTLRMREAMKSLGIEEWQIDTVHKVSWKDNAVRTIDRMISWMLYSMTFCFLFGVAGLELSTREVIAYSLMLGLGVGSINNIERVMRELFKKED